MTLRMKDLNEEVLDAWLRLTTAISNTKLVSDMPYNEALICNLLYNSQRQQPDMPLTATDLCKKTQMLKSQMNRTLQSMEDKGLIERTRSTLDKRQVFLWLNTDSPAFRTQHEKSLKLIDSLIARPGEEKAGKIAQLFTEIAIMAQETIQ